MTTQEWKEWYAREPQNAEQYLQQKRMISEIQAVKPDDESSLSSESTEASREIASEEPSTEASLSGGEGSEELTKKDMASLGLQAGALGLKAYQGSKQMQDRREQARYESQLKRNLAMQNAASSGHNWFR